MYGKPYINENASISLKYCLEITLSFVWLMKVVKLTN